MIDPACTLRTFADALHVGQACDEAGYFWYEDPFQDMGTAPYVVCTQVGCLSDYAASADMVKKLKAGKQLVVQTYLMNGQVLSIPVSLADFGKAYDGPATDPKVVEEQQRKLQEEMQKKAEEARKKLEAQQPAAAAPAPAKKP